MASKHHYVPRFYLGAFVDESSIPVLSTPPHEPYLWIADILECTVRKRSPKVAARLSGYYDINDADSPDTPNMESLLSKIESATSPIIYRIRDRHFNLSIRDRFTLANYVGLQLGRVPGIQKPMQAGFEKHANEWLRKKVLDEQTLRQKLGEAAEQVRQDMLAGRLTLVPHRDAVMGASLLFGLRMAGLVFAMSWVFILTSPEAPFYTSDNPVGLLTPDARVSPLQKG